MSTDMTTESVITVRPSADDDDGCFDLHSCERDVCRRFDVSVPVTIRPFAETESPEARCVGETIITIGRVPCESDRRVFEFTITQRIDVDIPIRFGAEVCLGETCTTDRGRCQGGPDFDD